MRLHRIVRRTDDELGALEYQCASCKRKVVVPVDFEPHPLS